MAGTVTVTYQRHRTVRRVVWSWTSDASGDASGVDTMELSGEILRIVTNPGATVPTDLYDIVINDEDGLDVAEGLLANRSATNSEEAAPLLNTQRVAFDAKLSLVVPNAGNAKQGVVTLYYR